ncbi:hypothetical protein FJZ19_03555 [Candidatus Pacearchaeota archaeon]|nr:hypothetical protein [Candidatus Pacearchaeota archaeon]
MSQITSMKKQTPSHWPTLNTVIMVEDVLKKMNESVISVAELKRRLPRQVNHNTLMVILEYLDRSNKILVGLKGITWVYTDSKTLRELIKKGTEI